MNNKRVDNTPCHCLKLRRTAGNVIGFYDRKLAPAGVTARQYSLLSGIGKKEPCSISQLAERTDLDRSTLARSLRPLIEQALVADGRSKGARDSQLTLTDKGKDTCAEAAALWQQAQLDFEKKLSKEQLAALEEIMLSLQSI